MVSIDGQSQPPVFLAEVLPWMLQSPLFPNIGILMSSTTESLEHGLEITKNPESLALKAHVLSIIAEYMERPFDAIAVEMVRSVVNLVVMEVSLQDTRTLASWCGIQKKKLHQGHD